MLVRGDTPRRKPLVYNHWMVPLNALTPTTQELEQLRATVDRVLRSGYYILGPEVRAFEVAFAQYIGVAHAVGVANGTDALELALRALNIGHGQRVAVVANAAAYGTIAALRVGAVPVAVDVDARSMTMDPAAFEIACQQQRIDAVIVTHLYGWVADLPAIFATAKRHGIKVIEDCAQSHGALLGGKRAGSFGDVASFSFYPTKNLGALGDGGAVATNDAAIHTQLTQLRQYGWDRKYHIALDGGRNTRLDEVQAAILSDRLKSLDAANALRRTIAQRYKQAFQGLPTTTPLYDDSRYVAHLYVIQCDKRDALKAHLTNQGIGCDIHYPIADHLQPALKHAFANQAALPVTERLQHTVLTLPCYPGIPDVHVDAVVAAVRSFFG